MQLEYLLLEASKGAPADDVLLVLDSDAWPVASLSEHVLPLLDARDDVELVAEMLGSTPSLPASGVARAAIGGLGITLATGAGTANALSSTGRSSGEGLGQREAQSNNDA